MTHFADRLHARIRQVRSAACLGLDPRWEPLPDEVKSRFDPSPEGRAAAFEHFCGRVLEVASPHVAAVKPNAAFFEACGPEGMRVLQRLLAQARALGPVTILDGKRNDIASTAEAYADAAFEVWGAGSLTVNPYLGRDSVEPFLASARKHGGGVFVLVRTSNPGAGMFQDLMVEGRPLYRVVGGQVAAWARERLSEEGWGDVGAVVGATYPAELAELRAAMPEVIFLVPGYGAQGGTAEDVRAALRPDGTGAVVNSSRGILFPFHPSDPRWEDRVAEAARKTAADLRTP
jgi:orotidine-5'-phosphate decarboxylase